MWQRRSSCNTGNVQRGGDRTTRHHCPGTWTSRDFYRKCLLRRPHGGNNYGKKLPLQPGCVSEMFPGSPVNFQRDHGTWLLVEVFFFFFSLLTWTAIYFLLVCACAVSFFGVILWECSFKTFEMWNWKIVCAELFQ